MRSPPCRSALLLTAVLGCALLFAACTTDGATWKGTRETRDGITYVTNPAEPMEPPRILDLRELWRISSEGPDGRPLFGAVEEAKRDAAGNVYLLDTQLKTVHMISPEGEYLRALGREGEGPGEFQWPLGLVIGEPGRVGVLDAVGQKIVFVERDGTPAGEWRPSASEGARFSPLFAWEVPRGVLLSCQTRERGEESVTHRDLVALFGNDQQMVGTLAEKSRVRRRGEPVIFDEAESESYSFIDVRSDGTTYLSPRYSEYRIEVFDPDLALRMVIERDFDPVPRTAEQIADVRASWEAFYRRAPNVEISIQDFRRCVMSIHPRADGTLWVETSGGWARHPEGTAVAYDVFDRQGRFTRQVALRGRIDPWEDYVFILADRLLLITAGFESSQGARGASTPESAGDAPTAEPQTPTTAICYQLTPAE